MVNDTASTSSNKDSDLDSSYAEAGDKLPSSSTRRASSEISTNRLSDDTFITPDRTQTQRKSPRLPSTSDGSSKSSSALPLSHFWANTPLTSLGRTRSSSSKSKDNTNTSLSSARVELIMNTTTAPSALSPQDEAGQTISVSAGSTATLSISSSARVSHKSKLSTSPTQVNHPPLDSYKFKIFVEASVKVGKTKTVYAAVRSQLLKALALLHEVDPSAAFLPHELSTIGIPIYDPSSFPEKQYITGIHYFTYSSEYQLFSTEKMENGCWVHFTSRMGFTSDPYGFLPVMKVDLMTLGAMIEIRSVQALDTCSNIIFVGAPQNINKDYAKDVIDRHLKPLKTELMELDSITYPSSIHALPWPDFAMACDQPAVIYEPGGAPKGMARQPLPHKQFLFVQGMIFNGWCHWLARQKARVSGPRSLDKAPATP
jgi:hypothetical protein